MAPDTKNTYYISRVTDANIKAIPVYWIFSEANCHTRFGTCADIVSYLCKFETNWHQILDASLRYIDKVSCRKKFKKILFQSRVNRHVCDVINFMINVILSYLLVMQ